MICFALMIAVSVIDMTISSCFTVMIAVGVLDMNIATNVASSH